MLVSTVNFKFQCNYSYSINKFFNNYLYASSRNQPCVHSNCQHKVILTRYVSLLFRSILTLKCIRILIFNGQEEFFFFYSNCFLFMIPLILK